MANLLRLTIAAVLALMAFSAHALLPKSPLYTMGGLTNSSASALCAAYKTLRDGFNPGFKHTGIRVVGSECVYDYTYGPANDKDTYTAAFQELAGACPANSNPSGDQCACAAGFEEKDGQCKRTNPCPAGQHEEGGACVPDDCKPNEVRVNSLCVPEPPCPAGETRVNGVCKKNGCKEGQNMGEWETQGDSTTFYCEPSGGKFCTIKVIPSICVTVDGHSTCTGTGRLTGGTCTPGSGSGDPSKPNKGGNNNGDSSNPNGGNGGNGNGSNNGSGNPGSTPGGGTGGGNNGGNNGGSNPPNTNPGTQPDPTTPNNPHPPIGGGGTGPGSGAGLPAPKPEPAKPDGDCPEGTTKQGKACIKNPVLPGGDGKCPPDTVKVGGKCVYTYTPDGPETPGGGTGGGDGDGDGDGDSLFSGSCLQGFVCEGDAVQCAIAREQHRRACKLFEDKSKESDLYEEHKGKEGDQTKDLPGNKEESLLGKVTETDLLGVGQGVQDLQVTVAGQSITLPFSKVNTALQALGNILLAVSLLAAVRIIGRG